MFRSKSSYTVQSVEKALDILELLADELSDATLPHLAEKLGISRNKAFRLLATLESRGLVQREEHSGIYRVGLDTCRSCPAFHQRGKSDKACPSGHGRACQKA